jgi:hypothetical protein
MPKLKTHKTVEQIAKKHRLDVSFIQKQLDMGEPIEHEHTQDHDLARDIALQHLDEIPDYYTRLKKMEADAKKHHKKFKDVKIDEAGSLHHWFQGSSGKTKSGKRVKGWVQADGSPCANEPGETKTPKCFSSARLAALRRKGKKGESIIKSAVRRKRQEDSGQQQKSGATKPTNVPTFAKGRKSKDYVKPEPGLRETMEIKEAQKDKPGKGSGTKDACYHKVKSRYSVWPSAYASGALVKCRRVGADNWGTKSESTMQEEERYCPLCDKRETRSECSYGGKAWDKVSVKDHEYSMVRSELETLMKAAQRIQKKVGKGEGSLEAWVQSKITKAADYIDTAADYIDSGEMEESIGYTINPSAHKTAQKREKIRTLTTRGVGGEQQVAKAKLGQTAELPKVKEESLVDKIKGEIVVEKCWPGYKKKGMKTMFGKRYPNCVKAEDVTIEDANGNTFAEVVDLIQPEPIKGFKSQVDEATRLQSQSGNIIAITLSWRGKYYAIRMFFPQAKLPSRQEVTDEIQKVYPGGRVVYHAVSEFTPGQPLIQAGLQGGSLASPGPSKKYVKPYGEQVEFNEDWQKVNRQDKTDGLSQAAVNAYRRENPGSKLQTAVTEKKPKGKRAARRKSFCSRMKGMKSKLTSAKTAKDPDSRINKALRRWNCN